MIQNKMIVLASKSPRRKELMKSITNDFIIFDSNIDEDISYKLETPLESVIDIAKRKALKAKETYPNEIIIAADTIVVLNNNIIHKPKDKDDAFKILKNLSNKEHEVITAYAINKNDKMIINYVISRVIFNDLSDELILNYIASGSPLDKAGSYGIQDNDSYHIIKSYEGDYNNIVGFPVDSIRKDLKMIK